MTTTRERLERRWSPGRVVLLIVGIVVAAVVIAALLALWWLPPVLAETPRERFETPTRVTVQDASGSASVQLAAGWVPLGVGPFLAADAATAVSPDGVYRASLGIVALPDTSPGTLESAGRALLTAQGLAGDSPSTTAPDAATSDPENGWSEETLTSGIEVRYTDVVRGDTTHTVALAFAAPGSSSDAGPDATLDTPQADRRVIVLTLVADVPTREAAAYRTVTADLLASAALTPASPSPAASPPPAASPSPAAVASGPLLGRAR